MKQRGVYNKVQSDKHPRCIWMQAGVVVHKNCKLDYECHECRFHSVMSHIANENNEMKLSGRQPSGNRGRIVLWKDKLKELPQWKRPCVHHMKGRIEFRSCTNEYRCSNCEFDQYFYDQFAVNAVVKPVDVMDIKGFKIPQGYYLHPGHVWLKIEENSEVRIGMDDFILRLLGPLDQVNAPLVGKKIHQNQPCIHINRDTHSAKVLSAVDGVVMDVNPKVRMKGQIASDDPYSDGWIFRAYCKNLRKDLKNLMMGTQSQSFLNDEVNDLYQLIEEETDLLVADGGYLHMDFFKNQTQISWEKITGKYLRNS